jgi:SAM-dependent methyltransferase
MSNRIIDLHQWFQTPAGQHLLGWERELMDDAVADIFGYHALQLGLPELNALQANRMPHQWLGNDHGIEAQSDGLTRAVFLTDFSALPFPASSLDLVVLPHTLEFSPDPHATLRDVERVLVPEGKVVICGLNPLSLWGLRQQRAHLYRRVGRAGALFLPDCGEFIGYWRLRDWLRLLSIEVEHSEFGCYRPALDSDRWLERFQWMDRVGPRWWPIFGAAYFVVGIKRVRGMRLLSPAWRGTTAKAAKQVTVANRRTEYEMREQIE